MFKFITRLIFTFCLITTAGLTTDLPLVDKSETDKNQVTNVDTENNVSPKKEKMKMQKRVVFQSGI